MTNATLIIAPEELKKVRVRIILDVTLEECAAIENELGLFTDRTWAMESIRSELQGLRKQAESAISDLKFNQPSSISDAEGTQLPTRENG